MKSSGLAKWPKRIFLFFMVNILVMITISVVTSFLGIGRYLTPYGLDYTALAVFCLLWGFAGALISLGLSRMMAKWMMGVQVIDPKTHDHKLRWLVSRVHHYSQRAGLETMPEVGIYDSPELNAFATGPTRSRALVAVSTGLLHQMSETEVEGVLAHEVAHIANGDMVTMTLIQGIVNAFVMFIARIIGFVISQNVREESRPLVNMLVVLVLDILLSFLGMIVVAYFSRLREYRADKGGAELAGREKMVSALRALQMNYGLPQDADEGANAPAYASLKIGSRKPSGILALFSTHPPLEERIRALQTSR